MSRATFDKLRRQDARRSPTARAIDNKIKAPIDHEGTRWKNQPNRYDVRGIDYPKGKRRDPFEELNESLRKSKYFRLIE